jgi:hypothetical protein
MTTWLHEWLFRRPSRENSRCHRPWVSKQAARHTRAALPIEGQIWLAQRYAVDCEQLGTLKPSAMSSGPNISSY